MNMLPQRGGILIRGTLELPQILANLSVPILEAADADGVRYTLAEDYAAQIAPDFDTLEINRRLDLDTVTRSADLAREILLCMLLSPIEFVFPSEAELVAHVKIRQNIVAGARRTQLDFSTSKIERPSEYWTYHPDTGFTLLPGQSLIDALRVTTQPEDGAQQYSFSCYRASEYVMLLGIAEELQQCNPALFLQLQRQWQSKDIASGKFHDVFLREYGSMTQPLPPRFYVPGGRLWFRNPDDYSSEVGGYEGSWVIYLGGGLFSNFWNREQPFTLTSKCLEIYHWRHGVGMNAEGELQIDEAKVAECVQQTMQQPHEVNRILNKMLRFREPAGVYVNGGCIDSSREYPRWVCPGTSDIVLPSS